MTSKLQLLPPDIETRLERLSGTLRPLEALSALWLFGSFARGEATPVSDVDLAYLADSGSKGEGRERFDARLYQEIAHTLETDEFSFVDLERAPAHVAMQVLREGRLLYCREATVVAELAEKTFRYAPDESLLRQSGNRLFLEAIDMAEPRVDVQRLTDLLRLLADDLRSLQEKAAATRDEYCGSRDLQAIVERRLQTATESCINVGNHLIARLKLGVPSDYADVFRILSRSGLLPVDLAERMADLARFRNLLVHVYWTIDHAQVHQGLPARLATLVEFSHHIGTWLKTQPLGDPRSRDQ
jgi:uncharacterized protein YutE (UPF0331/DUF86 family)/predicted nucleotidyltransferase